jgi:hypothetical protein
LDFGNSKILDKKRGTLNYSLGLVKCYGNTACSSTNALKKKDTLPNDDLESLFYI